MELVETEADREVSRRPGGLPHFVWAQVGYGLCRAKDVGRRLGGFFAQHSFPGAV